MTFIQIIVLSFIQALSAFLPISSSGHLILVPLLTGWPYQGIVFDMAVQMGSIGAACVYFWKDVRAIFFGLIRGLLGRSDESTKLALTICIATIPVVIIGLIFHSYVKTIRGAFIMGIMSLVFGSLLYLGDRYGKRTRTMTQTTYIHALWMGLAQVIALIPGVSRSGAVLTVARSLGYERSDAVRYAFLIALPVIGGAGLFTIYKAYKMKHLVDFDPDLLWGFILSFVFSLATIHFMMRWVQTKSLTPFVVYRWILGIFLLGYFWFFNG